MSLLVTMPIASKMKISMKRVTKTETSLAKLKTEMQTWMKGLEKAMHDHDNDDA
jgi:hypothetical protein